MKKTIDCWTHFVMKIKIFTDTCNKNLQNTRNNCKRQAPVQIRNIMHEDLPGVICILRNTESCASNYSCEKID